MTADAPMERLQVDLVDFSSKKSRSQGKTYSYILSALDVFSRYLFLQPLAGKESVAVADVLKRIFQVFGYPSVVQTDKGSEFKGRIWYMFGLCFLRQGYRSF